MAYCDDGHKILAALQASAENYRDVQTSIYVGRFAVVLHYEYFDAVARDASDCIEDYDGAFFRVNGMLVIRRVDRLPDDIGQPPRQAVLSDARTARTRRTKQETQP